VSIHRIPILGAQTKPDFSGNVYQVPYSVHATNDFWDHLVWEFLSSGSAKIVLHGQFSVPKTYVGATTAPKIVIVWTATLTSNNIVWDFAYRAVSGDNSESLDQSSAVETVSITDAAPGAANRRLECSTALTAANIDAGDTIQFRLSRDKSSGSDTLAGSGLLVGAEFEFADA
jgi:hypothetical protein